MKTLRLTLKSSEVNSLRDGKVEHGGTTNWVEKLMNEAHSSQSRSCIALELSQHSIARTQQKRQYK